MDCVSNCLGIQIDREITRSDIPLRIALICHGFLLSPSICRLEALIIAEKTEWGVFRYLIC